MLERIAPDGVVVSESESTVDEHTLLPEELAALGAAAERRRLEFATARACAHRAMAALGLSRQPLLRGPSREPLWPHGVVGSITHCPGYCAAAVARQADVTGIGIDAELHDALPEGVLERIALPDERQRLADRAGDDIHWDRLLFSAKESVFKAWFPLARRWLGFHDARVTFDAAAGTLYAELLVEGPTIDGQELRSFAGRYRVSAARIVTLVWV